MPDPGSIRAGRAVVEIAGNKDSFERAVVDSQSVLDTFAGAIDASIAPVEALQGKIDSLATVGAGLAGKLGFGDIAVSLETVAAGASGFVGQASGLVSAVADTAGQFGKLKASSAAALESIVTWGVRAAAALGPVGATIASVAAGAAAAATLVANLATSAAEEEGRRLEAEGKALAEANQRNAKLALAAKSEMQAIVSAEFDALEKKWQADHSMHLTLMEEEFAKARDAKEALKRLTSEAAGELDKLKTPAMRLAEYLEKIARFRAAGLASDVQVEDLVGREAERLAGKNLGPQEAVDTPAQALASSALRGSAEAAETIARSQAAILKTDSKADEQVAQQRRTNELLAEGNKIAKQRAAASVEIYAGN